MSSAFTDGSQPTEHPRARHPRSRLVTHARRLGVAGLVLAVAVSIVAFLPGRVHAATFVGVKPYYLGLGDSLAFGYEPNGDWSHGYVQQWYTNLKSHGATSLTNYGCNGEKSSTFINGGCPYWYALHNYYFGAQLSAAVNFIKNHAGKVSPVSLDMGANDVLPDINGSTCQVTDDPTGVGPGFTKDLNTLDANMKNTILPKLTAALKNSSGQRTGDLVMMNYYNPFAPRYDSSGNLTGGCTNTVGYIQTLNNHLAADAAQFGIPLADVYTPFATQESNNSQYVCSFSWMCSSYGDIHATGGQSGEPGNGYGAIAGAFESTTGY